MYNRGFGHMPMCPHCGGMHPPGECPMMMFPPAMPMPSVPMPPMGGFPIPPMGGVPVVPPAGEMPMGGMMPGMAEHMAKVEKLLMDIKQCCDQTCSMVKEMYMKMAKG